MRVKTPVLVILLLLAVAVQAVNTTLTPATIYETTKQWETLDVNNYQGNSIITEVSVSSPSLAITDAETYLGWTTDFDASSAEWTDGMLATNARSAVFEFQVSAPNVTADTIATVTASLGSSTTLFNITILNDPTPPSITEIRPYGYAKANNPSQSVSANATDAETSIASVSYEWNDCNGGASNTITLLNVNGTYNGAADFSAYDEGEKACYTFTARNTAGETATLNGELLFDGTPPSATIISPTAFATENTVFVFTASDNIAAGLSCQLELDSTMLGITNVTNGTTANVTYNLSIFEQGSHTWSITCTDGVGLEATHAQAIILDTMPPVMISTIPSSIPRNQPTSFSAKVTDNIGLASVTASFDGNDVNMSQNGDDYSGTISSSELGTETLTIEATDDAGHTTTETKTITIVPNHQLTLTLSDITTTPGHQITASGTLTPDGNLTENNITIRTPTEDYTVALGNNAYSVTFNAPDAGTYVITAEYTENGHTYTAQATLNVRSPGQSAQDYSHGYESSWSGGESYVAPEDSSEPQQESEPVPETEQAPAPEPETEYVPLPPEEPRESFAPKSTGVFSLGKTIKWLSLLMALGLILGLAAYTYSKRPKKEEPLNWDGYFNRGP